MTSALGEYIGGPWNAPGAINLQLDDKTTPPTERSLCDEFIEEANKYLAYIARFNSAISGITADGTILPFTTPDAPYFPDILNPYQAVLNTKPLKEANDGATIIVYEDGRRQYRCRQCGKLHDRKSRADDCRNIDLGIKPYRCHGECGKNTCKQSYASEALLRRHRGPEHLRIAECAQCHLQLYKQNLARHLRTCKGSPPQQGV